MPGQRYVIIEGLKTDMENSMINSTAKIVSAAALIIVLGSCVNLQLEGSKF